MYSSPAAPGGPWYPELKWFIPLYESYKYGQLFHSPSFLSPLAWVSQTGCGMPPMEWRIPLGVGRKRGVGFQVWVTVGRKGSRSCLFALWGWQQQRRRWRGGGWSRVLRGHSLLSSHSQLLPGGWVGGRGYEIPWCTLLRHAGLGAEWGDNEVDPVEYCWEKHCATLAARRGRMNELHVDRSAKKLPPDAQKGSDKTQQSECNRLCSSHQSWVFSFSHSFLISEMIKKRRGFKFV